VLEITLQTIAIGLCITVFATIVFGIADALLKGRDVDWTRFRLEAMERRRKDGDDN